MLQIIILSVSVLMAIPVAEPIKLGTVVPTVAYPFAVHLLIESKEFDEKDNKNYIYESTCGGTLLTLSTILTAAHCLTDSITEPRIVIHAGDVYLKDFGKPAKTRIMNKGYTIHEEYEDEGFDADIAIIKFSPNLRTKQGEIQLGTFATATLNQEVTIMGWGAKEDGELPDVLLKGVVKVNEIGNGVIHPFDTNKKTTICSGDSGSPLVSNDGKVLGVASNSPDTVVEKLINGELVDVVEETCTAEDPSTYMDANFYKD